MNRNTFIFSMIVFPAMSIPCGLTKEGLPVGLQLVALPYNERKLFKTAFALEESYLSEFYIKREEIINAELLKKENAF